MNLMTSDEIIEELNHEIGSIYDEREALFTEVLMRDIERQLMLDIVDLQKSIQNTMPAGSIPDNVLTASSFAIEMVESAGRQIYESGNPDCGTSTND